MKVVIMGCGRVGARLATLLEQDGHEISIIDSDPIAFSRLPDTFTGQTILGTGIDVDVLKSAGIEHAQAFAAVTNYDNTNIMACEVAKEIFGVPKVLARIYDPGRESFYHQLGLETVCPTTLVSTTARNILSFEGPDDELHHATGYSGGSGIEPDGGSIDGPSAVPADTEGYNTDNSTANLPAERVPGGPDNSTRPNGRGLRGLFRP